MNKYKKIGGKVDSFGEWTEEKSVVNCQFALSFNFCRQWECGIGL
jgi:hypothetical protein